MTCLVAIQMDPLETIDITKDTTFLLGLEAQRRGHRLYYYAPESLAWEDGQVTAAAYPLTLRPEAGNHYTLGKAEKLDLATADVVLMRQDPPFDLAYMTAAHLLALLPETVRMVNAPLSVILSPEKLYGCHFREFMPPTLITRDRGRIAVFREAQDDMILKPLYRCGGEGVFHLRPEDGNGNAILELLLAQDRAPLIAQRYIPAVREGDKRIILIDGEPVGAVLRVPESGETRANFHAGGRAQKTTLSAREQEICAALGPDLRRRGLFLVGIDVIGEYLTEINVTSPTGFQEINRLDGVALERVFWDKLLQN